MWRQQSRPSAPLMGAASVSSGVSQREAQCTVEMLHMTGLKHISSGKMNISLLFKLSDKQYEQQYTYFSLLCLGLILGRIYILSELDIVNDTS